MVSPDSDRVPRAPPYSGTDLTVLVFAYEAITLSGDSFQSLPLTSAVVMTCPTTPSGYPLGLGLSDFARHYFRNLN
jgi:hypothetical protein